MTMRVTLTQTFGGTLMTTVTTFPSGVVGHFGHAWARRDRTSEIASGSHFC